MNLTNFRFETDAEGVALVTWDMPGRSMNVINNEVVEELGRIVDKATGLEKAARRAPALLIGSPSD